MGAALDAAEAEKARVHFSYVDLRQRVPQMNILAGCTEEEALMLLVAGLSLSSTGRRCLFGCSGWTLVLSSDQAPLMLHHPLAALRALVAFDATI